MKRIEAEEKNGGADNEKQMKSTSNPVPNQASYRFNSPSERVESFDSLIHDWLEVATSTGNPNLVQGRIQELADAMDESVPDIHESICRIAETHDCSLCRYLCWLIPAIRDRDEDKASKMLRQAALDGCVPAECDWLFEKLMESTNLDRAERIADELWMLSPVDVRAEHYGQIARVMLRWFRNLPMKPSADHADAA